jgi:hypothetical protein
MKQLAQNEFWLARRDPLARLSERRPHLRRLAATAGLFYGGAFALGGSRSPVHGFLSSS